jgi:hypothetical protein
MGKMMLALFQIHTLRFIRVLFRLICKFTLINSVLIPSSKASSEFSMNCLPLLMAAIVAIGPAILFHVGIAAVTYDTAWTSVYDGPKYGDGTPIRDIYYDVKCLPNGSCVCVGASGDTTNPEQFFLMKFDSKGNGIQKKMFSPINPKSSAYKYGIAHSIFMAKNGDLIVGGERYDNPWVLRPDSLFNFKWSKWYFDSTLDKSYLSGSPVINSLRETSRGTIICAVGDPFPDNNGQPLTNYAAMLEFDSSGRNPYIPTEPCFVSGQFWNESGYLIGGFNVDETKGQKFVLSGNQSVYYTDSIGNPLWKKNYTFTLTGVGTKYNNVCKAKVLRDNTLMISGQAYESDCWTRYQHLYYDAWWAAADLGSGANKGWHTTGKSGDDDVLCDFTQLNNGNLVFVGTRGGGNGTRKIWVFVTDSLGNGPIFDKEIFPRDSTTNRIQYPMSVTASPDNGFTVVGYTLGQNNSLNKDAFVMHFIAKPATVLKPSFSGGLFSKLEIKKSGTRLWVSLPAALWAKSMETGMAEVGVFDIAGKLLAKQGAGKMWKVPVIFNISRFPTGMYFVRLKLRNEIVATQFLINHSNLP